MYGEKETDATEEGREEDKQRVFMGSDDEAELILNMGGKEIKRLQSSSRHRPGVVDSSQHSTFTCRSQLIKDVFNIYTLICLCFFLKCFQFGWPFLCKQSMQAFMKSVLLSQTLPIWMAIPV